jgi:hypothetical protein
MPLLCHPLIWLIDTEGFFDSHFTALFHSPQSYPFIKQRQVMTFNFYGQPWSPKFPPCSAAGTSRSNISLVEKPNSKLLFGAIGVENSLETVSIITATRREKRWPRQYWSTWIWSAYPSPRHEREPTGRTMRCWPLRSWQLLQTSRTGRPFSTCLKHRPDNTVHICWGPMV